VHFFEVATKPFSFAAALQDLFEVHESDRVHAVEHILEHTGTTTPSRPKKKTKTTAVPRLSPAARLIAKTPKKEEPPATVRSTFACTRICCSAEIPAIRDVLEGVPGIANVMTNVPLKQVIVDHVADKISATQIAALLNESDFGATVKRDGGAGLAPPPPTTGRSQLYVQNICCASEIPAVEKILLPLEGVVSVSINTTTKTVYVDHDTNQVSATDLCDALNRGRFGAQVRHDAATTIQSSSARTTFVKSTFTWIDEEPPDTAVLTAFLKSLDTSQMETFLVDVPAQQMEVLHNPFSLTAESIAAQLREQTGIAVAVDQDGADPAVWHFAPASDDVDVMEEMEKEEKMTWPRPTVIISGVLWVISMLSLIGGNWYVFNKGDEIGRIARAHIFLSFLWQ
jgi:copper chaperone CopZ